MILCHDAEPWTVASAQALRAEAEKRGHGCSVADPFSFLEKKERSAAAAYYDALKKKVPLMSRVEKITDMTPWTAPFHFSGAKYVERLGKELCEGGYDGVLCFHYYAMEAVFALKKKEVKLPPCYGVITEYTCPPFFRETGMEGYFLPHPALVGEFVERGVGRERLFPCGLPAPQSLPAGAGRDEARNFLVLPRRQKICLLLSGGMSGGNAARICDELLRHGPRDFSAIVMADRGSEEKELLAERYASESRVQINAYNERMDVYLRASDVMIGRPAGAAAGAAALAGIPTVLLSALPGGAEARTAEFFAGRDMAVRAGNAKEAAHLALELLRDGILAGRMAARQKENALSGAAERILDILESARETGRQ